MQGIAIFRFTAAHRIFKQNSLTNFKDMRTQIYNIIPKLYVYIDLPRPIPWYFQHNMTIDVWYISAKMTSERDKVRTVDISIHSRHPHPNENVLVMMLDDRPTTRLFHFQYLTEYEQT